MPGYIKLHRDIQDHWINEPSRPRTFREAWEDILMSVNHADKPVFIKGQLIECKRGQSLNSLQTWANNFNWSIGKVRNFFELLKKDQMITWEGLKYTTRLTVCKYEIYQGSATDCQQTERITDCTTDNILQALNKNVKNVKKFKEEEIKSISDEISPSLPVEKIEEKILPVSSVEKIDIDFKALVANFHHYCPLLPKVQVLTEARKKAIKARVHEHGKKKVLEAIKKAGASKFLNGDNDRGFTASFDYIFTASKFVRILEGNYDNDKMKKSETVYKPKAKRKDDFEGVTGAVDYEAYQRQEAYKNNISKLANSKKVDA